MTAEGKKGVDLTTPLGEAELDELEELFVANDTSVPWVEGLLAAVHTGPEVLPPTRFLPLVFGEDAFEGEADAQHALELTMRLYHEVGATLRHDPRMIAPEPDDVDEMEAFADGYLAGAQLHASWERDGEAMERLEPLREIVGESAASEHAIAARRVEVAGVVAALWKHWESAREASAPPPVAPAKSAKVGRNELCPCGSGKKYKRCCAN